MNLTYFKALVLTTQGSTSTSQPTLPNAQIQPKKRPGNHQKDAEKPSQRQKRTCIKRVWSTNGEAKIGNLYTYSISNIREIN
jgi:hypothetical protein